MGDQTIMQKKQIVDGIKALGSLLQKFVKRVQGRLLGRLDHLTTAGKTTAAVAAGVAVICAGLIAFDASHLGIVTGKTAIVTGKTVNVRKSPTTRAKILTQAHKGDRFEIVGSKETWTNIRSLDGKVTGWMANSLFKTKEDRTFVYRYDMKGYILFLVAAVVAFLVALRLKEKKDSGA